MNRVNCWIVKLEIVSLILPLLVESNDGKLLKVNNGNNGSYEGWVVNLPYVLGNQSAYQPRLSIGKVVGHGKAHEMENIDKPASPKGTITKVYGDHRPTISGPRMNQSVSWREAPDEIDYRKLGYLTRVDDQGSCKSCWAFAAVGAIEGLMKKEHGSMWKLSCQQIIDCNQSGHDCRGGTVFDAMRYAMKKGLMTELDYEYVAKKQICKYNSHLVVFKIKDFVARNKVDEIELKDIVANVGPIVTNILITKSFEEYRTGIFSTDECQPGMDANHSILIVGYGTDCGEDYWIIKNTSGPGWGEDGFIRFKRNIGLCLIGNVVYWPIA